MTDDTGDCEDLQAGLASLHDHLAATAELPVERSASRWLGEAEALAADLHESDLPDDVVVDRLETVADLLAEVDGCGDERADEYVAAARAVCEDVLARYG